MLFPSSARSCTRLALIAAAFAAAGVCSRPASAQAIPISSLFSTGQGIAEGSADPHYALIAAPAGVTLGSTYVTVSDGFPIGPWIANEAGVKWIEPTSGTTDTHPVGSYTFRTTFSLAGFNAGTAQVSLALASDNNLASILLNGASIGSVPATSFTTESAPVSITSGFVGGLNTLDFVVNNVPPANSSNPTGLRVRVASATASTVPEPATASLLLLTVAPVVCRMRKRRAA